MPAIANVGKMLCSFGLLMLLLGSTLGISGCAECLRYESRMVTQQYCARRSSTGHCAHMSQRTVSRRVCAEYKKDPPKSTPVRYTRKAPARTDKVTLGNRAYKAGKYKQAVSYWRSAALTGNAVAQSNMAIAYRTGRGVSKSDAEAVNWDRKSANQGYKNAQFELGVAYRDGRGVRKDDKEAVKWMRKSALQGYSGAQHALAYAYQTGQGVPRDDKEAAKWYRKAALQGNASSQNNLGYLYRNGLGVPKNAKTAVSWYRKAAEKGNRNGQANLARSYRYGNGVPKNTVEATKWYRKAANQGDARAKKELARLQGAKKSTPGAKQQNALNPGWLSDPKTKCSVWNSHRAAGETVRWSGQCRGGRAHGKGVAKWSINGKSTDRFEGRMSEGKIVKGVSVSAAGERYEGTWRDSKRHGRGKITWTNGVHYDGQWREDQINGRGQLVFADGSRFAGGFIDGRANGFGKCRSAKGRTGKCEYRSGKFVRWVK